MKRDVEYIRDTKNIYIMHILPKTMHCFPFFRVIIIFIIVLYFGIKIIFIIVRYMLLLIGRAIGFYGMDQIKLINPKDTLEIGIFFFKKKNFNSFFFVELF